MDLTTWIDGLSAAVVTMYAYGFVRCWSDVRRSCRLRYRQPATVRRQFARALRSAEPMATPERRRDLLAYVAAGRGQIQQIRSAPMKWMNVLMPAIGILEIRQGLIFDSLPLILLGLVVLGYPLMINAYVRFTERRLDRAELANGGPVQPVELYAVEPACVDMISN